MTLSNLSVLFEVGYDYIEALVLEKFSKVTIPKIGDVRLVHIHIQGEGDRIHIAVDCSGDFNGRISIIGVINFDQENQIITCDVEQLDVKSSDFLFNLGSKLFKNMIIKKVEEISVVKVKDLEHMLRKAIYDNTEKLESTHVFITAKPLKLKVNQLTTKQKHVALDLALSSNVNVQLGKIFANPPTT